MSGELVLPLSMYGGTLVVDAQIVDVAPHLADFASFAVDHLTNDNLWRVSVVETGCYVTCAGTKAKAIEQARASLLDVTPGEMRTHLELADMAGRTR